MIRKIKIILSQLGPGILFAAAAIGASHIVQSTRAGAAYGFYLLIFVILSNLFKYPFFEYGHRYTAATGESIISGYKKIGNWALNIFVFLNIFTSVISSAGVTIVTAAISSMILKMYFNIEINIVILSSIILLSIMLLLYFGKYKLMDKIIKVLIGFLAISTTVAFIVASFKGMNIQSDFKEPELLNMATFGSLIALMGWMPAPIEASTWSSVWAIENNKNSKKDFDMNSALIDFKVGYIGTAILACFFLGLGAFVMYGSGQEFSDNSVVFIKQVIDLYTNNLGAWSTPIISLIALVTMASTTITVIDAYPRTINEAIRVIKNEDFDKNIDKRYWVLFIVISIIAIVIISQFSKNLKNMVDFATIISFIAAPIFSYLNYKLVISNNMPSVHKPNMILNFLSISGLIFLSIFTIVYLLSFLIS